MNRLDGKIAVVTGSTQGLGLAIARRFASSGAAGLVTCGRSSEKGREAAAGIERDTGIPVVFVTADLASVDDCRSIIGAADERFGRVDVLVNAGAKSDRGSLVDTSQELFDAMFAINVRGPFFLMQEATKVMIRTGTAGSIINIGSMAAIFGTTLHFRVLRLEGCIGDLDPELRFCASPQPDQGQPAQYRVDEFRRRGRYPAEVSRCRGRLGRGSRQVAPLWPAGRPGGGCARGCIPGIG